MAKRFLGLALAAAVAGCAAPATRPVGRYVRLEHEEWLATRQSSHTAVELMSFSPPS